MQMSGILSNVLDGASTVYKESIPLSDDEKVFKRDMRELLVTGARCYRTVDDGLLEAYLNGAVLRFKHLQVLSVLAVCAADGDERF